MPIPSSSLALVCAPSGTGFRSAQQKIKASLDGCVAVDIEDTLCELHDTEDKLHEAGYHRPPGRSTDWPGMMEVTWRLSRSQVGALWDESIRTALQRLRRVEGSPKILFGHLMYYGADRHEFYSPVNASLLLGDELCITRIIVLIDDVYDMYARLADDQGIFNPKTRFHSFLARIRDEEINPATLPPTGLSSLCLEWQVQVLTNLLAWRHLEIIAAENLARQAEARFLVCAVKQLTSAVVAWLSDEDQSAIYLSHPISRPRRSRAVGSGWPAVVNELNEFQELLSVEKLFCIMPTSIDEYRIENVGRETDLNQRRPHLTERWPLARVPEELLYDLPSREAPQYESVLAPKIWDFTNRSFIDLNRVSGFSEEAYREITARADLPLRVFEREIAFHVSSRDHLFVAWCEGILVHRPLYESGEFSSGVKDEITHWSYLARADSSRKGAFIHFKDDVRRLIARLKAEDAAASEMDRQIKRRLVDLTCEAGVEFNEARRLIEAMDTENPVEMSGLLSEHPLPDPVRRLIEEGIGPNRTRASFLWLYDRLSGADIGAELPRERRVVWVFDDHAALRASIPEIAAFLRGESPGGGTSPERLAEMMPDLFAEEPAPPN